MQDPERMMSLFAEVSKILAETLGKWAQEVGAAFTEFGRAFMAPLPAHQRDYALVPPLVEPTKTIIVGGFNNEPGKALVSCSACYDLDFAVCNNCGRGMPATHRIVSWDDSTLEYKPTDER
jgi:hypothetical protein